MSWLELKVPPVIVAALCGLLMWALDVCTHDMYISREVRVTLWSIFMVLAITFGVAGVLCFRRHKTTVNPMFPRESSALVTDGVYRATRNPMYFALLCVLFAWWCYLTNVWSLTGCVLFVLYMNRFQIEPEERVLASKFGEAFNAYKAEVRRWI
ncbi:isoprenylcysteine carboxylmethyltransferase family protein [Neptunomonas phycophila]|jgi:protein-S-isoprenylcysteine O-methyltransferase Ste14|uniref:Isoprenylcysteine carboxylmethyltransferase family protein n=1 Tax=Neptunomonas phycophila TaxID=1572645 RepID=A0AAW7XJZ4_9GAMM|nr:MULTISPECIES: isoprenylcysteine carboxylmethyltransferase family protein [Neptunomonas]MBT3147362.1 isoprenylcysteine carboxylmethyltransferase family protein [Neptunomonas phycophila]MDN2660464.1 isoprenylcysteine carboxylmethyltransferase family protein [Neptunomonas sp. CHC150]MDO6454036.1 isoprenylcysteine carboxylmethyltransferase family protein [Neptunomonas phycophila]MDO6469561.1 isoprenylcysteine carboxylmethyltransferase family protein [Neptunomonas phycophila]MDO6785225.1 isopren